MVRSLSGRLLCLIALLLGAFSLLLGVSYNTLTRRMTIRHYSLAMQRDAYAISQNLGDLLAPPVYDVADETRFVVSEDMLGPYLALTEHLTRCNVYLVDVAHNVTGYFDGVVQTLEDRLLPGYLEQTVALGFMGKTPFIQTEIAGDTHLTACKNVMTEQRRVQGVVLLEGTLRELGYAHLPNATILLNSVLIALGLTVVLAMVFSVVFTRPISRIRQTALALAAGRYDARTGMRRDDEIGSLGQTMDVLAGRLSEAQRLDEQLHHQQQQLFSNISHELRTPVTVIRGSLEALRDGVVTDEAAVRAYYSQMIHESRWLEQLIRDLLELSRLQSADFPLSEDDVELSDLLGDVAMSMHALCDQKGVALVCEEPTARYRMRGARARLRQMLMAVADNAVKFTPAGRTVRLWLQSDAPVIGVRDEGPGIPESDLPLIFERFHRAPDAAHGGTGLGLSIVREVARRHGVDIQVESRLGEGATFLFRFPAQKEDGAA